MGKDHSEGYSRVLKRKESCLENRGTRQRFKDHGSIFIRGKSNMKTLVEADPRTTIPRNEASE